ncbi:hypothetical protein EPN52_05805 [bacterium]|nr:MAG: hypothetical protein EPN52_05805 [bacterium]
MTRSKTSGQLRRTSHVIAHPDHLYRTILIGFAVGTWLTLFNEGDALWRGGVTDLLVLKIVLNYITPIVVANLGLLSGHLR